MCGFAGIIDGKGALNNIGDIAQRMADAIRHRGPDDTGLWIEPRTRVAMAFRRLSIQDLSQHGHQPMRSESGRWVISYNGEVYNFLALRKDLQSKGHAFRGGSDTEVILAAVEEWGIDGALDRLVGMFAIALWDCRDDELFLIRDRFGVKPLYFGCPGQESSIGKGEGAGRSGQTFYFGSELKALRAAWDHAPAINRYALRLLLRYQYVPAPWTLWSGIRKLMPGQYLRYRMRSGGASLATYWSAGRVLSSGARDPLSTTDDDAIDMLEQHVDRAIRERMIADVPFGAFLSGGIDSSVVVAAMRKHSTSRIKTFTIGSDDLSIDESREAQRIADHLGTDHHTLRVSLADARDPILRLGELADEPLGDASFIPTYLVSRFAREQVTVILSGDGGDEVFAGYPQHRFASQFWGWQRRIPQPVARMLRAIMLDEDGALRAGRSGGSSSQTQMRLAKALRMLGSGDRVDFMSRWRNVVHHPERILLEDGGAEPPLFAPDFPLESLGPIRSECWADIATYMPDDILLKVDRASMAVSLEAREPLLDSRLFEFAARIPEPMLIRNGDGKWILRQLLYRSVPRELVDQPKRGFALPVAGWVVGPLRDWAEALISEERLRSEGFFQPLAVRSAWKNICEPGSSDVRMPFFGMWSILAFQAWYERWN